MKKVCKQHFFTSHLRFLIRFMPKLWLRCQNHEHSLIWSELLHSGSGSMLNIYWEAPLPLYLPGMMLTNFGLFANCKQDFHLKMYLYVIITVVKFLFLHKPMHSHPHTTHILPLSGKIFSLGFNITMNCCYSNHNWFHDRDIVDL